MYILYCTDNFQQKKALQINQMGREEPISSTHDKDASLSALTFALKKVFARDIASTENKLLIIRYVTDVWF